MQLISDIVYDSSHDRGKLDIMLPEAKKKFPVVICIHGGGWQGGEKEGMHLFGDWLVELGVAAVLPNYRLTGTDCHPAQERDIFSTIEWIADSSSEYGWDCKRLGITGVSAGGHLTSLVGLKESAKKDSRVVIRGMVPICAPSDMLGFAQDNPGVAEVIEALVGGPLADKQDEMRDVSPIYFVHPKAPPCLATHGVVDSLVPVSQTTALVEALKAYGVEAEEILVPGADHTGTMPDIEPLEPLGGLAPFQEFWRRQFLQQSR